MSGSDACAAIRKISDVPIIMFTSSNEAAEVRDAILKGATDFVLKSTGVSVLTERVKHHLARPIPESRTVASQDATHQNPATLSAPKQGSPNPTNEIRSTSLIVDPDEASRGIVKAVLIRLNQDVIEVSTAEEAVTAFKEHRPEILITEWALPGSDGYNLLTRLKRGRSTGNAYKLIMSQRLTPEAHRKARFAGAHNFLNKPLDPGKVEMMIADYVRKTVRKLRQRASKAA
jgi:DNA-binding response OmpR family regulator